MIDGLPREIAISVDGREHLSCAEVARLFSCSALHIVNLCAAGSIQGRRVDGTGPRSRNGWRVPVPALREFIRRKPPFPLPE